MGKKKTKKETKNKNVSKKEMKEQKKKQVPKKEKQIQKKEGGRKLDEKNFQSIVASINSIMKKDKQRPVEFNENVTNQLTEKLKKLGDHEAAESIQKVKVDTPKAKKGFIPLLRAQGLHYSLPVVAVFLFIFVGIVGLVYFRDDVGDTITALKEQPSIPLITMNPTELTESGYVSTQSELEIKLGSSVVGELKDFIKIEPEVDFELTEIEEKDNAYRLSLDGGLDKDQIYVVSLVEGTQFENGSEINKQLDWQFSVDPDFAVIGSNPRDNAQGVPTNTTVEIVFNHVNLDLDKFKRNIRITPNIPGEFKIIGNKAVLIPTRELPTYTDYKVVLSGDFANNDDEKLADDYTFSFQTGSSKSGASYNYLNWGNYTEVISTTNNASLNAYLSSSFDQPYTIKYSIYAINVNSIDQLATLLNDSPDKVPEGSSLVTELSQSSNDSNLIFTPPGNGLYIVKATSDGAPRPIYKYLFKNELGIVAGSSATDKYGWVYNMNSKTPVNGVQIAAVEDGEVKTTSKSNSEGFFELAEADYYVGKGGGEYFYFTDSYYGYGFYHGRTKGDISGFDRVYLQPTYDKPVYRYGDTVKVSGFVKGLRGQEITPVRSKSMKIEVTNPVSAGRSIDSPIYVLETDTDDKYGVFESRIKIPENLDTSYLLVTYYIEDIRVQSDYLDIEDYSLPEESYTVEIADTKAFSGESITAYITGRNYNGTPLAGKRVTANIFRDYTDDDYRSIKDRAYCYGSTIESREIQLDKNGRASVSFTPVLGTSNDWNLASFGVDLDVEGEFVYSQVENDCVLVSAADYEFAFDAVDIEGYSEGDDVNVSFESYTLWDEKPAPEKSAKVRLYRHWTERIESGSEYNPDTKTFEPTYDYVSNSELVKEADITTGQNGNAEVLLEDTLAGSYYLEITTPDFNKSKKYQFTLYGNSDANYGNIDYPEVDIGVDQASVGDEVSINISSTAGLNGVYAVQGVDLLSSEKTSGSETSMSKKLKITKDMYPRVSVCMLNIQEDIDYLNYRGNVWWTVCDSVKVDSDQGLINVSIETDKDSYAPGDEVKVTYKTTNSEGKGVVANIQTSVVNQALLDQYPYADTEYEADDLRDLIYSYLKQTGSWTSNVLGGGLGGFGAGGGGDEPVYKREVFKDSGYWNAFLTTNSNGEATVTFKANDTLTEWRIQAIATDGADGTGAGYTRYKTYMDRYVNVLVPDFIRDGDKITADLQVVNNGKPFEGKLLVRCEKCVTQQQEVPVTISQGGAGVYDVKISNTSLEDLDLDVVLYQGEKAIDNVAKEVEVIPVGQLTKEIHSGTITQDDENMSISKSFTLSADEAKYGSNYVNISRNSGALFANVPFEPSYSNTSSLASAIAINSYVLENYDVIKPDAKKDQLIEVIQTQYADMIQNQTIEGGFGDISYDSTSLRASVMAANAFYHAENAGVEVGLDRMTDLELYLTRIVLDEKYPLTERLYALSGVSKLNPDMAIAIAPKLKQLFEETEELQNSPYAASSFAVIMADVGSTGEALYFINKLEEMGEESNSQIYWSEPENDNYTISDLELTTLVYTAMAPLEEWGLKYKTRNWLMANNSYTNGEYVYYTTLYALSLTDIDSLVQNDSPQTLTVVVNGSEVSVVELTRDDPSYALYIPNTALKEGENKVGVVREGEGDTYIEFNLEKVIKPEGNAEGQKASYRFIDLKSKKEVAKDQIREGQYLKVQASYVPTENMDNLSIRDQWSSVFKPVNLWLNGTPTFVRENFYEPTSNRTVYYPNLVNKFDISGNAYQLKKDQRVYFEYVVKVQYTGEANSGFFQLLDLEGGYSPLVIEKGSVVSK